MKTLMVELPDALAAKLTALVEEGWFTSEPGSSVWLSPISSGTARLSFRTGSSARALPGRSSTWQGEGRLASGPNMGLY
jgi:hypothetical protein